MKPQEWQVLSTYIDNQLSPEEKAAVEKRLSTDPEIQKALEELLQTRALLRRMPQRPVPHNFTLTPEMVSSGPSVAGRLFPVFSFSSALASVLLVISIVFQWGLGTSSQAMQAKLESADMASAYEVTTEEVNAESMTAGEEPTPPIILWGEQDSFGAVATGKGGSGGGSEPAPLAMEEAPETLMAPMMEEESAAGAGLPEDRSTAPALEMPQAENAVPEDSMMEEAAPQTESLPADENAAQMREVPPQESSPEALDGGGPILGIPSEEEGQMLVPEESYSSAVQPEPQKAPRQIPVLQIILGTLALASGITALLIHRKNLS